MSRLLFACALLAGVVATLGTAPLLAAPPAGPVDQRVWASQKKFVRLPNGVRLAYVELGNPAGRPVLLLHGYTDTSRSWSLLAPWLSEYRLLIPDQRGHGASDAPLCCYSPSDFVEDARLFLDALGVENAAVAGHSMGSIVAQLMAAEHPGRVDRIVLAGSTALVPVTRSSWMWTEIMALREPIASNREFLSLWSPAASPTPVDPVFVHHVDQEVAATPPHVWRSVLRELLDVPAGRFAQDVRSPVLILSGGRDEIFTPEHHRALETAYPMARALVFPELGHNLIWEQPDRIGPVLDDFLADREADAR